MSLPLMAATGIGKLAGSAFSSWATNKISGAIFGDDSKKQMQRTQAYDKWRALNMPKYQVQGAKDAGLHPLAAFGLPQSQPMSFTSGDVSAQSRVDFVNNYRNSARQASADQIERETLRMQKLESLSRIENMRSDTAVNEARAQSIRNSMNPTGANPEKDVPPPFTDNDEAMDKIGDVDTLADRFRLTFPDLGTMWHELNLLSKGTATGKKEGSLNNYFFKGLLGLYNYYRKMLP